MLLTSGRRCCLCRYLGNDEAEKKGQIAHLDHDNANAALDNLVFLCLKHHDEYDSRSSQAKGLKTAEVRAYRDRLHEARNHGQRAAALEESSEDQRRRRAPAVGRRNQLLEQLRERIDEGEEIHGAIQIERGRVRKRWIRRDYSESELYREPDRHVIDWKCFVEWRTRCASLLCEMIPAGHAVHENLARTFANLQCGKAELEWGVATLKALKQDVESGLLA